MADTNYLVSNPTNPFTTPRSFKSIANGKIYIGQVDTDPANPVNQIPVYLVNEDGSEVQIAQPIIINAGGFPVYNGQIAKFITKQNYSMAVYDAYGAQQYYWKNISKVDPGSLLDASMVMTVSGWTVQAALYGRVPATAFGVVADYNPDNNTGTDCTDAIDAAIEWANDNGMREVYFPAGRILTRGGHSLGGTATTSSGPRDKWDNVWEGTKIVGAGSYSTIFVFEPQTQDDYCFAALGGWGSHSPRGIFDCSIMPRNLIGYTAEADGTALLFRGCCFVPAMNINVGRFHRGVHFWNKNQGADDTDNTFNSGDFTEFNKFFNVRVYRCDINFDFHVTLGNNSFHGNEFTQCMSQIKPSGGISVRVYDDGSRSAITTPSDKYHFIANPYNCTWDIKHFGSNTSTCYLYWLQNAQIRNGVGDQTVEGNVTLRASEWEWAKFSGALYTVNSIEYECPNEVDLSAAESHFIFSNRRGPVRSADGSDKYLASTSWTFPVVDGPDSNFGSFRTLIRNGNAIGTAHINVGDDISAGWVFGNYATSVGMGTFRSKYRFNGAGNSITGYADSNTLEIGPQSIKAVVDAANSSLRPSVTNVLSLGNTGYRFTGWSTTQASMNSSGLILTSAAQYNCASAAAPWNNIYSQNAVIVVSDKNYKEDVSALTDAEIKCAIACSKLYRKYRLKKALEEKGDTARFHFGVIAQDVIKCFTDNDLNWKLYGIVTYEKWDAADEITETVTTENESGESVSEVIVVREQRDAGEIYMVRYDELNSFITAGIVSMIGDL